MRTRPTSNTLHNNNSRNIQQKEEQIVFIKSKIIITFEGNVLKKTKCRRWCSMFKNKKIQKTKKKKKQKIQLISLKTIFKTSI